MTELYIVVSRYPFGIGEPFLEDELKIIAKKFDKIFLVIPEPHADILNSDSYKNYMPPNASVIKLHAALGNLNLTGSLRALFQPDFWAEISYIRSVYKLPLSMGILKHLLAYFVKAKLFADQMAPYLKGDSHKVLYHYWCNEYTYGSTLLKDHDPGIKLICRIHGWDVYFERNEYNYLPLRRTIFSVADRIFTISENGKKYMQAKLPGVDTQKIITSYLGTIGAYFKAISKAGKTLNIVSLSYLVGLKRLDKLIDVLAQIPDAPINWIHIGGGPEYERVAAYAAEKLSSSKNVTYHISGLVSKEEIYRILHDQDFHFVLNCSETEGLPVSLMEAMSFGIPCIAPAVGGVPEIVVDGYNGILMSAGATTAEIKAAIYKAINMDERTISSSAKMPLTYGSRNLMRSATLSSLEIRSMSWQ
jgi:glycosyltransferase involved in cell wall biosynthesis